MRDKGANPDRFVAALAARQHGVVSAKQLRTSGIDKDGIARRVTAGRLHRVHRGIYAVGYPHLRFEGRCMAAAFACGERAYVSHRSAATLWRILPDVSGPIQITIGTGNGRKPQVGIEIHRSRSLQGHDIAKRAAIPVTAPARTLRDLRRSMAPSLYLRVVRRALDLQLIEESGLRSEGELTRSELERRFIALCRRNRIPAPTVNAQVGGYEVDFLWVDHALIVETDGFRYHAGRVAFEADRARDAELQALGYRVVRFTFRQVETQPKLVVQRLREMMRS